ncbi:MAG: hypothetical protein CVV64_05130 [Candidatus Wallbacteria bacterium HGW-Wallbacteria-1]|uniref:Uncharacterized protein n=1 Tax=Candidatus Wallbacteria bacterium HGW-Wallbacteria-1 TaxID=2013854 RepID=A0A2N1PS45_9BACT|nr:MAG: hypothetical protein CVV64_05130 [Candidatus Wallbacteria bacterium HGW-Wallbacteria-1]
MDEPISQPRDAEVSNNETPREPGPFLKLIAIILLSVSILWLRSISTRSLNSDLDADMETNIAGPVKFSFSIDSPPLEASQTGPFTMEITLEDGRKTNETNEAEESGANCLFLLTENPVQAREAGIVVKKFSEKLKTDNQEYSASSMNKPPENTSRVFYLQGSRLMPIAVDSNISNSMTPEAVADSDELKPLKILRKIEEIADPISKEGTAVYIGLVLQTLPFSESLALTNEISEWCGRKGSELILFINESIDPIPFMKSELQGNFKLVIMKTGASIEKNLSILENLWKGSAANATNMELTFSDLAEPLNVSGVPKVSFGKKILLKTGAIPTGASRKIFITGNCFSSIPGRFPIISIKAAVLSRKKIFRTSTNLLKNFTVPIKTDEKNKKRELTESKNSKPVKVMKLSAAQTVIRTQLVLEATGATRETLCNNLIRDLNGVTAEVDSDSVSSAENISGEARSGLMKLHDILAEKNITGLNFRKFQVSP